MVASLSWPASPGEVAMTHLATTVMSATNPAVFKRYYDLLRQ